MWEKSTGFMAIADWYSFAVIGIMSGAATGREKFA